MKFSSALLSCGLLLVSCSQLQNETPEASAEVAQPAIVKSELAVETGLPEVRYYLIADT